MANGSMNVSFTVRLTDGDKAWLNGHYPNGSYIEGFLYADSCDGDGRQLSVPMLGFYGSWAEPSMYDKSVYLEDMCTEGATGYVAQRTNFLVQRMAGSTSGYYFGGNLYADMLSAIDTLMQSPGTRLLLIALVVAGLGELLLRIFFGLLHAERDPEIQKVAD